MDENAIFSAYDKLRSIEDNAKALTKKMRRNRERSRLGIANARNHLNPATSPSDIPAPLPSAPARDIQPFDDVDDMRDESPDG